MHVLPEWVTIVLLIVYYSNGLFCALRISALKETLSPVWLASWSIVFIAGEVGLFITALLTAKNVETVLIVSFVAFVMSIPLVGYALSRVAQENPE